MVQTTNKNLDLVKKFKERIGKQLKINRIFLFGSRAKGTYSTESDFDLIIVSEEFKNVPWHKRPLQFYLAWKEDYPLEILCYTSEELEQKQRTSYLVREALEQGIEV